MTDVPSLNATDFRGFRSDGRFSYQKCKQKIDNSLRPGTSVYKRVGTLSRCRKGGGECATYGIGHVFLGQFWDFVDL